MPFSKISSEWVCGAVRVTLERAEATGAHEPVRARGTRKLHVSSAIDGYRIRSNRLLNGVPIRG